MKFLPMTSVAVLVLGGAGLAMAGAQKVPLQESSSQPNNTNGTRIIVVHERESASQYGDLTFDVPQIMELDMVYMDGRSLGAAGDISDLELFPGSHQVKLRAPDGTTDYQQNVAIAAGEETALTLAQTVESTQNSAAASSKGPLPLSPAAGFNSQQQANAQQPASTGDLNLKTPSALRNDAVFINGEYAGVAKTIKSVELTPGVYNVALCAPDGKTDFQGDVTIAANSMTNISSFLNG